MLTGTLQNWYIDETTFKGHLVVRGYLYGDVKERWREGEYIRTSSVVTPKAGIVEGAEINTLNSTYLLGKPAFVD